MKKLIVLALLMGIGSQVMAYTWTLANNTGETRMFSVIAYNSEGVLNQLDREIADGQTGSFEFLDDFCLITAQDTVLVDGQKAEFVYPVGTAYEKFKVDSLCFDADFSVDQGSYYWEVVPIP